MSHQELIKNLNPAEKLELMEELWQEISSNSDYESPKWHGDILNERDKALKAGKIGSTDWKEAKKDIRNSIEWN